MTKTLGMLTISVTQEDIKAGVPHSPYACPIAKALQRATDTSSSWWGKATGSILDDENTRFIVSDTSGLAADFVYRFDEGRSVAPFTFSARTESYEQ